MSNNQTFVKELVYKYISLLEKYGYKLSEKKNGDITVKRIKEPTDLMKDIRTYEELYLQKR